MKKKIISMITAFAAAFAAVPLVSSGTFKDTADQPVLGLLEGFTEVEDGSLFLNYHEGRERFYFINDETTMGIVLEDVSDHDNVWISIPQGSDAEAFDEQLREAVGAVDSSVEILHQQGAVEWGLSCGNYEAVKDIFWKLDPNDAPIERFTFNSHMYSVSRTNFFRSILTYSPIDRYGLSDESKAKLQAFAEANDLEMINGEYTAGDHTRPYTEIIPPEELTGPEKLELAVRIKEEVGIVPDGISLAIYELAIGSSVEMKDTIMGDANADSQLDLNDAVAVLQYVALPEKYPLTAQGQFNADCDGEEGITGKDALWIQQKDAGLN